jgi:hypothetical protein
VIGEEQRINRIKQDRVVKAGKDEQAPGNPAGRVR